MVLTRSIISKHSQGGGICFHVHSCGCDKSQGLMAVGLETLVLVYTSLFILASPMTRTGGVGAKDDPEDRFRNALVTILKRDRKFLGTAQGPAEGVT